MRIWLLPLFLFTADCAQAKPDKAPQSFCHEQVFETSHFTVCDNKGGEVKLFAAGKNEVPARSFSDLMRKVDPTRVAFAMNAGMFDEQGRPIGYAVADGRELHKLNLRDGPGNFHLKPNGVFIVGCGGGAMISPSDAIPAFRCAPHLMTQSGPMLVIQGKLHPKLQADGQSRLIRNGVGVRDGKAVFVISKSAVSLGKFARFFRDELKTPDALYFDGSVSSLWDPANGRQDSHSELGPIVVAFKPEASKPGRGGPAKP
ncbi:phosphodiester glycosidase family protein [Sphingomonas alba]|uniref:Phosphodiester glycosidase family protein n=1 Tax=Sphingomonas alba TaxID=2908208 RepID=A0ABT0RIC7_9SPHN|nr:phosphodiester glycosidase family protein [Sphingomonas alba]MCL6682348.1 phosphodiester glycosidase family protein [Sphingomonas alba]